VVKNSVAAAGGVGCTAAQLRGGPEDIDLFFDGGEVLVAGGEGGFAEGGEGGGETVGVGELVMGAEFCERCG